MNRKPILWAVIVLAVGFVVFRTQRSERRELEKQRGFATISERTEGGHAEWYSPRIRLPGRNVEWSAVVFADPSKPPFSLLFAKAGEQRETWEADAKMPVAIIADGRRYDMKPFQAVVSDDGDSVTHVSVVGSRSILEAGVAASKAEIEFGGKLYAFDAQGMANCRELLKRSEGKAKQ
jgi:hypothetical protein